MASQQHASDPESESPCSSQPSRPSQPARHTPRHSDPVPTLAISSLETICGISEKLMREHHRLHAVIECSYGALLAENPAHGMPGHGRQLSNSSCSGSPKIGPPDDEYCWEESYCPSLPLNLLNANNTTGTSRRSAKNGNAREPEIQRHLSTMSTGGSGLPEFVKQFTSFDPPWSVSHKISEESHQSDTWNGAMTKKISNVTKKMSNETEFKRNLASDFAFAQGWMTQCMTEEYASRLQRILDKHSFDTYCALFIIANSLLMAIATDYAASNAIVNESDLPVFFRVADLMFSAWFLLELVLRVASVGLVSFWSFHNPLWTWNYFDTLVVTANAVDIVLRQFNASGFGANATALRTVRVLRVARAMRVVRLFRFFRTLRMMVLSMLSSFTALLWAMVLLAVIMFTFAIFLTQNVTKYLHEDDNPMIEKRDAAELKLYFGRLVHTVYYLFLSISGGISWVEVSTPLFNIDTSNGLLFCLFIFASVFAMLNIITGIFLDTAMRAAQSDKDESIFEQLSSEDSTISALQNIFEEADMDKSGELTASEFHTHLSDDRVRLHLAALGIEAGKASALFRLLDLDDSGTITVDEFLFGCMRIRGGAKGLDVATLLYENKRLLHKWVVFMTYVEKQFKSRKTFEARLEQKLNCVLHLSCSSPRKSAHRTLVEDRAKIHSASSDISSRLKSDTSSGARSLII